MDDRDTTDHRAVSDRRSRHLAILIIAAAIIAAAVILVWFVSLLNQT